MNAHGLLHVGAVEPHGPVRRCKRVEGRRDRLAAVATHFRAQVIGDEEQHIQAPVCSASGWQQGNLDNLDERQDPQQPGAAGLADWRHCGAACVRRLGAKIFLRRLMLYDFGFV